MQATQCATGGLLRNRLRPGGPCPLIYPFHRFICCRKGGVMQSFNLVNIIIIAVAAVALVVGAVLHKRALKKALVESGKLHVRGLRRFR